MAGLAVSPFSGGVGDDGFEEGDESENQGVEDLG